MRRIKWCIYTGYVRENHSGVKEFDDNVTDDEINEYMDELLSEYITMSWWEEKTDKTD